MKATFLPRSPADALFLALWLWLGSDVDSYLVSVGIGKPLYAYLVLLVFAVGYLCMQGALRGAVEVLQSQWTRRFLLWLLLYIAYGIFAFVESSQSEIALQSLIDLCEAVVLGSGFAVLMVHPRRLRQCMVAFALLALFASGMNMLDFIDPIFSGVPGRGAGFYINPNISGAFVALAMLCGVSSVARRWRWPFVLICGIGVMVTFSREAWLMWGVGVAWLGWHLGRASSRRRLIGVLLSFTLGTWFLLALFFGQLGGWLAGTHLAHYLDSNTLARLGVGGFSLSDDASQQRGQAALYALHQASLAPLFGHGIGYVFEWDFPVGPHNMFLRFLVEGGLVGLLLYIGLFWLLWRAADSIGRLIVLLFIIASLFSHNLLDQPEYILILTFIMVEAAVRHRQQRSNISQQAQMATN